MLIDTEKNQKFLALIYSLQNNLSNAVSNPAYKARMLQEKRVYRAYDNQRYCYVYGLEPIEDMPSKQCGKSGRPKTLTSEQKEQITAWKENGISNRVIAKELRVSEGTVRNFLKSQSI